MALNLLWMTLSAATAPIYAGAALFVAVTVVHAPALASKITSIFLTRAPALSRAPTAYSMVSTRSTVSRMSSVAGLMSGVMPGGAVGADPGRHRSRHSMPSALRGDGAWPASPALPPDALDEPPAHIWGFPHLDTDSTVTLVKRAVLWEAACAACTVTSLLISAIGASLPSATAV